MKIELKSVKFYESMSEETNCFTADIFVNGVKTASAKNDGQGGCTNIHPYPGKTEEFKTAEAYCLLLPDRKVPGFDTGLKMDLEVYVDDLLTAWIEAGEVKKVLKKLDRLADKYIVVINKQEYKVLKEGKLGSLGITRYSYKKPLKECTPEQRTVILEAAKKKLKPGEIIYNTIRE